MNGIPHPFELRRREYLRRRVRRRRRKRRPRAVRPGPVRPRILGGRSEEEGTPKEGVSDPWYVYLSSAPLRHSFSTVSQPESPAGAAPYTRRMIFSDRDLHDLIDSGRLGIDPFDPRSVQPSSIDLRIGHQFRVFANNRYPYIDVRLPMDDLTELVE